MRACLLPFLVIIVCLTTPAGAQEDESDSLLSYGRRITGEITPASPRAAYFFDGLRGEVVAMQLRITNGDLDPVLTLVDSIGQVIITRDDTDGQRDVRINAVTLPRTDRYYVIVSRFGVGLGVSRGAFELDIQRIGVSGDSGSALRYGDAVISAITDLTPQIYYSFQAQRGDILDIVMQRNSGSLDPYLQVVNNQSRVIADNDDIIGSGSLDAAITGLVIEETGPYVIVATRYGEAAGASTGRFLLTLRESDNSGLGNAAQTAVDLAYNATAEGELTPDSGSRYYTFVARKDDLLTVRLSRISGSLDAFLVLADANLNELVTDDDGGGGQNAQVQSFRVPEDGKYYIIATRLDRDTGTTEGRYRLELQSLGNAFDGVPEGTPRIAYGSTITGRVDDLTPQISFAFWGAEGDAVTLSLNRGDGDLDPVLRLFDSSGQLAAEDDDGGDGQNARIARYVLPRAGIYTIVATRYTGTTGPANTQGSFILVLARLPR